MKKVILSGFIALSLLFSTTSCNNDDDDRETVITAADLPTTATTFATTYFPNTTYTLVQKKNTVDSDGSLYEVKLSSNFEIEFDANGNWIDVDGNNQVVPTGIIPEKIQTYVTTNYSDQSVTSIDKETAYIEVKLSNNVELIFDLQGNFIRIDK